MVTYHLGQHRVDVVGQKLMFTGAALDKHHYLILECIIIERGLLSEDLKLLELNTLTPYASELLHSHHCQIDYQKEATD